MKIKNEAMLLYVSNTLSSYIVYIYTINNIFQRKQDKYHYNRLCHFY